jgi:Zn-dependent protease with chaperone function
VHDDLIARGRRRMIAAAVAGVTLLACTIGTALFPIAWLSGAVAGVLGGPWGLGWELVRWAAGLSLLLGFGLATAVAFFTWRHAERDVLFDARAWPRPLPRHHVDDELPPGFGGLDLARVRRSVEELSIAYGTIAPRVAVVDDPACNSLTIGRRADRAWLVVTTGLLSELTPREIDAVVAFQLARIASREVALDTIVYACTARARGPRRHATRRRSRDQGHA